MYAALLDDATTLGLFGEQDMSQLMWASSYLEQPPPLELMDAIAHVALDKIDEFTGTGFYGLCLFVHGGLCILGCVSAAF